MDFLLPLLHPKKSRKCENKNNTEVSLTFMIQEITHTLGRISVLSKYFSILAVSIQIELITQIVFNP